MSTDADAVPAAVAPAKRAPINKYAFACALLASMNSVLLGYGACVLFSLARHEQRACISHLAPSCTLTQHVSCSPAVLLHDAC
jgi:hypothetical protein